MKRIIAIVTDIIVIAQSVFCVPFLVDKELHGLAGISVIIALKTLFTIGKRDEDNTKKNKNG